MFYSLLIDTNTFWMKFPMITHHHEGCAATAQLTANQPMMTPWQLHIDHPIEAQETHLGSNVPCKQNGKTCVRFHLRVYTIALQYETKCYRK